eukprot:m.84125 g.84125  ORF g.84125 m.84125 type:complete len:266 (+) comp36386_c0_seq2:232-1029(+)
MENPSPKILKLHSPNLVGAVRYQWPLQRTEIVDEATEITETIRWVCRDFPDMAPAIKRLLEDFDPTSYESMKVLCDRYNKSIDEVKKLWSGRQPPACLSQRASPEMMKHIMNQVYHHAIPHPEKLNSYEPFSPEVYGETSFDLVLRITQEINMSNEDVFVDLGSGVGQVVLQVAALTDCKKCVGIEKANSPALCAVVSVWTPCCIDIFRKWTRNSRSGWPGMGRHTESMSLSMLISLISQWRKSSSQPQCSSAIILLLVLKSIIS